MSTPLTKGPTGALVCKFPAPHFEFPHPHHAITMCVASSRLEVFMTRDPRFALSQELEAKQTLLGQLRALAADDPDFLADLTEGETNLLELIAALDASIVDDDILVDGAKAAWTNSKPANAPPKTGLSSSAVSSPTPCSKPVSRPCAHPPPPSPSRMPASRRS
jgi:hypothetical protein